MSKSRISEDFKKPSLNKAKELLEMANNIWKFSRIREIKSIKILADDDFYIEIFEKEFNEIDFHDLKGAQSYEQKSENLQIMIDFLGNAVYEMDLSHIEPSEILNGNFEHIQRFVKLLYEWSLSQSNNTNSRLKKKVFNMMNSGTMPTADTFENINNKTESKGNIIDFYKRAKPELKVETGSHRSSKFRILSSDECGNNEIFKNMVKTCETPTTIRSSLTTSVNTTFLGGNIEQEKLSQDCKILDPSFQSEYSYEKSIEKGIIRSQVGIK